jgi:hypothetical protein
MPTIETSPPVSATDDAQPQSFAESIGPLLTDLLFPSESDEPIEAITCPLKGDEPLTVLDLKNWLMLPPGIFAEDVPDNWLWDRVTDQEWSDETEKSRNARFTALRQSLNSQLHNRQVFRVGDVEIEVYLLGQLPDGSRAGIKTKVIET